MNYYRIAEQNVAMETKSSRLLASAEKYRIAPVAVPDLLLSGYDEAAYRNHQLIPDVSEEEWVEILSSDDFYEQLLSRGGMFLHSSAVEVDGRAYLISAGSQVGKSTHTKLWQQYFGPNRALIINDDKPALREENGVWFVYGTPWSGNSTSNLNRRVPIDGICFLERSEQNWIQKENSPAIVEDLLRQTLNPRDNELKQKLLDQVTSLLRKVPTYRMGCNMDLEAAIMAYEFMSGKIDFETMQRKN